MQPQVLVRRAKEQDFPALLGLLERYFAEGEVLATDSDRAVLACPDAPALGFYVAESDTGLVGCVLCRALETIHGAAECKRLYVTPEQRGRGMATRLMDAVERDARHLGLRWMYLDSKAGFTEAIALYRRRGYLECPRYNNNPQATSFFRKMLP